MIARLPSSGETFHRIDALIQAGLRLARSAPSGRILLARIADTIDLEWIPRPWGEDIAAELEAANSQAREKMAPRRARLHRSPGPLAEATSPADTITTTWS